MSDDDEEEVRRLWNEGLSYKNIGNSLGFTLGKVAGICRKLGLRRVKIGGKKPMSEKEEAKESVDFTDLESHHCRWPAGRGSDGLMAYCGKTRMNTTTPYCVIHFKLSRGGKL